MAKRTNAERAARKAARDAAIKAMADEHGLDRKTARYAITKDAGRAVIADEDAYGRHDFVRQGEVGRGKA